MARRVVLPFAVSQLLTMEQLGARLGKSPEATRKWCRRANRSCGLPLRKAGRFWMVDWRDVDAVLKGEAKRAGAAVAV